MRTTIGSTDRLDVWRDLIREHFVALDIDADRDDEFEGTVRTAAVGHLRVASVSSRTQACRRTPGLASSDHDTYLQVGLVTRGVAHVAQDDREAVLRPGHFAVYETDRPQVRFGWPTRSARWSRTSHCGGASPTSPPSVGPSVPPMG